MQRRLACAALVAVALACSTLALARTASAVPLCTVGQIVKTADPSLSAPSPTYAGNTITSSGGSWASCGVSISGFYSEWLRDGVVVGGPTWIAGPPGPFTYTALPADVGHKLTSAVQPCNSEGCYGSYAGSSNAVAVSAPQGSPPPPPPIVGGGSSIVASGYLRKPDGSAAAGATVQLYRDADTDSSISQAALDETTTDPSGFYVLHASNTGDVAADAAANDGWVNFAIEANAGDTPYFDVVARRWDTARGVWRSTNDDDVFADGSSGLSTAAPDSLAVDVAPTGGSLSAGDWPSFFGSCKLAIEKTTLVRTEVDPTTIGELHVAKDATGKFSYGIGNRADSQISIASSVGGWHLLGFKHVATNTTTTVAVTNTGDDWARQIRSRFQYGLYKHERSTVDWVTGQRIPCGTSYTKEPRVWVGNIELGADLSSKLHLCQTKYAQWSTPFSPNTEFHRYSGKLQTWQGAASVDLGVGRLDLSAWSGASKSVGYDYHFGVAFAVHWLCGTDGWPRFAARIFAGG
ncbi:MAG TPA: hypothetical protein VLK24_12805 [Gaiellaceae bacterium]|nr:hypothetical protein [Gaiellaceae bacterium]